MRSPASYARRFLPASLERSSIASNASYLKGNSRHSRSPVGTMSALQKSAPRRFPRVHRHGAPTPTGRYRSVCDRLAEPDSEGVAVVRYPRIVWEIKGAKHSRRLGAGSDTQLRQTALRTTTGRHPDVISMTLQEFQATAPDEQACWGTLRQARGPTGFVYPRDRRSPRSQGAGPDRAHSTKILLWGHTIFVNLKTWLRSTSHGMGRSAAL